MGVTAGSELNLLWKLTFRESLGRLPYWSTRKKGDILVKFGANYANRIIPGYQCRLAPLGQTCPELTEIS